MRLKRPVFVGLAAAIFVLLVANGFLAVFAKSPLRLPFLPYTNRKRIALLLSGNRFNVLGETGTLGKTLGAALKKFVIEPLACDVFLYGHESLEASRIAGEQLGDSVTAAVFAEQMSMEQVSHLFSLNPRADTWQNWTLGRTNAVAAPGLLLQYWRHMVYQLAITYERSHGFQYDAMIFMRPDYEWMAEFPPLYLLQEEALYIADANHWGGINTFSMFCPRAICPMIGMIWPLLLNGSFVDLMEKANFSCTLCGHEGFQLNWFRACGLKLIVHDPVGSVVCPKTLCQGGDVCWGGVDRCKGVYWKDTAEGLRAEKNARTVRSGEFSWSEKGFRLFEQPWRYVDVSFNFTHELCTTKECVTDWTPYDY